MWNDVKRCETMSSDRLCVSFLWNRLLFRTDMRSSLTYTVFCLKTAQKGNFSQSCYGTTKSCSKCQKLLKSCRVQSEGPKGRWGGGRVSRRRQSIKGECGKINCQLRVAARIFKSLRGGSGNFHYDSTKILSSPHPRG